MNIESYSNSKNVVSYCEITLHPYIMNEVIKKNNGVGLSDPHLETNLSEGNYRAVLTSLWCERDRARRLEWLRSKSNEMHPMLMYEQAIAEFTAAPTADTVNLISIPLLGAAGFRTIQDTLCSLDGSVTNGDAPKRLFGTYTERLRRRVEAILKRSLLSVIEENIEEQKRAAGEKILATAHASLYRDLPSPDWVGWHGLMAVFTGEIEMHPASEHTQIRVRYAAVAIQYSVNVLASNLLQDALSQPRDRTASSRATGAQVNIDPPSRS